MRLVNKAIYQKLSANGRFRCNQVCLLPYPDFYILNNFIQIILYPTLLYPTLYVYPILQYFHSTRDRSYAVKLMPALLWKDIAQELVIHHFGATPASRLINGIRRSVLPLF